MKRLAHLLPALALTLLLAVPDGVRLSWTLAPPGCNPWRLRLWEAYIGMYPDSYYCLGPGDPVECCTGYEEGTCEVRIYTDGYRYLPVTQTSLHLSPGKPSLGCVLAWTFPRAIDMEARELPEQCQPYDFVADEIPWCAWEWTCETEGM